MSLLPVQLDTFDSEDGTPYGMTVCSLPACFWFTTRPRRGRLNRESEKNHILQFLLIPCKSFSISWLPRMDSNHDKVIQSHLVNDGCAIVATFSGFRAASLPVCPTGPSSSQHIEAKRLNFVLGT
jgi:hypothetical protein